VPPPPPHFFEETLSYQGWGIVWVAVALLCTAAIFVRFLTPSAVGAVIGLHMASATAILIAWLASDTPGDWGLAATYFSFAILTTWAWARGKSGEIAIRPHWG